MGTPPRSAKPSTGKEGKRFLQPFAGAVLKPPPIWLMRQAGRYLPEYREVRAKAGGFLDLCYTPELAAEVTLQPIRRFGLDAAIIFSDILVVPHALGQDVRFSEGEGPRLDPISTVAQLGRLDASKTHDRFAKVYEAIERTVTGLPKETALIGFCGAPWTVATYMVAGEGTSDQAAARLWAYRDDEGFNKLIDLLVATSIDYLAGQVTAGAEVLQIFDTWAGNLPDDQFERWVVEPTKAIVEGVKRKHPNVPIIGFPKGAGASALFYIAETGVDGIGCDTAMPPFMMAEAFADENVVVQGNLDPLLLVAGGEAMEERVAEILERMEGQRFIFNLGHGIVPQTPPENVARLVQLVREA
jgi:uroporphyrinogen decarboxylase